MKVVPTAKAFGVNLDQVATGYAIMTAKGIKAAETTTYMNSMFNELGKSGTQASKVLKEVSGKSFQELMTEGSSVGDVLTMLKTHADKSNLSLADMFGSAEAGKAALILSNNAGQDFNAMLKDMGNVAGATDEAFKKVTDTTGERFKKSLNQVKNESIKLGDSIAPLMDKLSSGIMFITDKLSGLSKEQLDSYVKWGMIAVASGGALKVLGGGISTLGTLAGGLSKITGALGTAKLATEGVGVATSVASAGGVAGLTGGLGALALAALPWVAGAGVIGLAAYGIHKTLSEETIPTVDLFADTVSTTGKNVNKAYVEMGQTVDEQGVKISEATKTAVGDYINLDTETTKSLYNLKINHGVLTEELATDLITKFDTMGNKIIDGNNQKHQTEIDNLKIFFDENSTLTEQKENEILGIREAKRAIEETKNKEHKNRVIEIITKAKDEHRELTQNELLEIGALQTKMRENAVKTLSETEQESNLIMERLKEHQGRLTAEMSVEILQSAFKTRDESIQAAKDQYEGVVKNANTLYQAGDITKDQYNAMVLSAQNARDGSIQSANDMVDGVRTQISNGTPGIEKEVNLQTGTIKTAYSKVKDFVSGIFSWLNEGNIWAKKNADSIANSSSNNRGRVQENWTGSDYFKGGLTTLHERGEEIYNLPSGTKIYNAERSEQMAMNAAEKVAEKVANRMLRGNNGSNGNVNVVQNIYSPTSSPSEIARQSKNRLQELALQF